MEGKNFCWLCGEEISSKVYYVCPCRTAKAKEEPDMDKIALIAELKAMREERDRLAQKVEGFQREVKEVEQLLGRALGMPWFCDDQVNFPGSKKEDGVCVGDHTAVTLAKDVANQIERLVSENWSLGQDQNFEWANMKEERDKLRAALKPFADEVKDLQPWQGADGHEGAVEDCPLWKFTRSWHGDFGPTVGDCLNAAKILKESPPCSPGG